MIGASGDSRTFSVFILPWRVPNNIGVWYLLHSTFLGMHVCGCSNCEQFHEEKKRRDTSLLLLHRSWWHSTALLLHGHAATIRDSRPLHRGHWQRQPGQVLRVRVRGWHRHGVLREAVSCELQFSHDTIHVLLYGLHPLSVCGTPIQRPAHGSWEITVTTTTTTIMTTMMKTMTMTTTKMVILLEIIQSGLCHLSEQLTR